MAYNDFTPEVLKAQFGLRTDEQGDVVTTGTAWLFLRLNGVTVFVDRTEYHISQVEKVVAILVAMLRQASEQAAMPPQG
jgi:hypothetical protein